MAQSGGNFFTANDKIEKTFGDHNNVSPFNEIVDCGMRKSLSMNDIAALKKMSSESQGYSDDDYGRYSPVVPSTLKLKPLPILKCIHPSPENRPDDDRKPRTKPVPFKLTEVHKKADPHSPENEVPFQPQPVPKHILEHPQVLPNTPVLLTVPIIPKLHYERAKSADRYDNTHKIHTNKVYPKSAEKSQLPQSGPVKSVPFLIEKRDEEKQHKEE